MTERFNPQTGKWEANFAFVEPTMRPSEIESAAQLVEASKIKTTDPQAWVAEQAQEVAQRAKLLHEQGLDFSDPGILIGFREKDLSIDALLEVMHSRGLMYNSRDNRDSIKGLKKRQSLRTSGGMLLADKQMQMRGQRQRRIAKQVTATSQKITDAVKGLTAIQLGMVPNLQLYNQSEDVRREMRGLTTCTPDGSARGRVECIHGWDGDDQEVGLRTWIGASSPTRGARVAVVKKTQD